MFFKFVLIAIFSLVFDAKAQEKNNENNKIYTVEEINADLLKRKKEIEGFHEDEVKVDLESLGLDDIEEKPEQKNQQQNQAEIKENNQDLIEFPLINKDAPKPEEPIQVIKQETENSNEKDSGVNNSTSTNSILSRIQTILKSNTKEVATPKEEVKEAPKQEYINPEKKKNIAKRNKAKAKEEVLRLKQEKARKVHEDKEKIRIAKLNKLRAEYLNQLDENLESPNDYLNSSDKIIPKRKELNKFTLEEAPPKPLIEDYRTQNNLHIPIMLKPRQRIEILFNSISVGSVSLFNDAYKYIKNPNIKNLQGDTLLTYAIITRKYPIIASIIAKGADLNLPNALGYTPMHIAIILNDFKTIEMLANNNADLNYVDVAGQNYLMYAVKAGNLSAVELFVRKGIDINAVDKNEISAIGIAIMSKQDLIAQFLLKNGSKTWQEKPYEYQEGSIIEELENRWK
jgi:ankyrin repeat protein